MPAEHTGLSGEIVKDGGDHTHLSLFGGIESRQFLQAVKRSSCLVVSLDSVLWLTLAYIPRKIQDFTSLFPLSLPLFFIKPKV